MKTTKKVLILIIISSLFFTSCAPDIVGIDPAIQPYVDSFFKEAEERGLGNLRPAVLNIGFDDISGAQGRTFMSSSTIVIDSNSNGWKYNPEALVYHELGHLILKREHKNEKYKKRPISIMSSEEDPVYDTNPQDRLYHWRKYYVDELFDPTTTIPAWMK